MRRRRIARHSDGVCCLAGAARERHEAAGAGDREHPGGGRGRGHVKEAPAAVLGLIALAGVDPDAGAALDPVGRRARNAEGFGDRDREQFPGPGDDRLAAVGRDRVDGARPDVGDHRTGQ